jgi:hypothetical protein
MQLRIVPRSSWNANDISTAAIIAKAPDAFLLSVALFV